MHEHKQPILHTHERARTWTHSKAKSKSISYGQTRITHFLSLFTLALMVIFGFQHNSHTHNLLLCEAFIQHIGREMKLCAWMCFITKVITNIFGSEWWRYCKTTTTTIIFFSEEVFVSFDVLHLFVWLTQRLTTQRSLSLFNSTIWILYIRTFVYTLNISMKAFVLIHEYHLNLFQTKRSILCLQRTRDE